MLNAHVAEEKARRAGTPVRVWGWATTRFPNVIVVGKYVMFPTVRLPGAWTSLIDPPTLLILRLHFVFAVRLPLCEEQPSYPSRLKSV